MYIYNITFATSEENREKLVAWIRDKALCQIKKSGLVNGWKLLRLVPSISEEEEPLTSICLHLEFNTNELFENWQNNCFEEIVRDYSEEFAPEPLFFATLLEEIDLKI